MSDHVDQLLLQRRSYLRDSIDQDNQLIAALNRGIEQQVASARHRIILAEQEAGEVERDLRELGYRI